MKVSNIKKSLQSFGILSACFFLFGINGAVTAVAQTEPRELSLADIIIALRSKKATLEERNKILSDAVKERGITFETTPEIEKELENTGADTNLISSIREKTVKVKIAAVPEEVENKPVPVATPKPPDATFYAQRSDTGFSAKNYDQALADITKAIELDINSAGFYFKRGVIHQTKESHKAAVADFSRAFELDKKSIDAVYKRALSYEKLEMLKEAHQDYKTVKDADPKNQIAAGNFLRLDQLLFPPKPVRPEKVSLGQINNSMAVKLVMPAYPVNVQRLGVQGKVIVEVDIDIEGNVTSARATSGHQLLRKPAEDAAERSKFHPAMFDGTPIAGSGYIVYSFSPNR